MKKLLLIIGLFIALKSTAQITTLTAKDTIPLTRNINVPIQQADYIISISGSTITAKPRIGSGYHGYTGTVLSTVLTSVFGNLTTGGLIRISKGTYTGNSQIIVPYAGISIVGDGMYTTIIQLKASADNGVSGQQGLIKVTADNVYITGLQLDGNAANQTKIDNNVTQTAIESGILGSGSKTTVTYCYIHDFTKYGYYAQLTANQNYISNCILSNSGWNQVTFDQNTTSCIVENSEAFGGADVGISSYGYNCIIRNNYVHDIVGTKGSTGSSWGIGVEYVSANTTTANVVKDNTITGSTMRIGIYMTKSGGNSTVEHNYIYNVNGANSSGIYLDGIINCNVTNNTITNVLVAGIDIDTAPSNTIQGNIVYGIGIDQSGSNGYAMRVQAFSAGSANNNVIRGNTLIGTNLGLLVNNHCTSTIVQDNTISGSFGTDFTDNGITTIKSNNYGATALAWLPGREDLKANLASPTFTGVPAAPTAASGTNTTQLATMAAIFAERSAAFTPTNRNFTGAGNTFPTFNQSTTGSAAKWTTARALAGNNTDGSAAVPFANKFIVQGTSDAGLTGAQFTGALSTGLLKNTTTTGVLSTAVAGTDYVAPITGVSYFAPNGSTPFDGSLGAQNDPNGANTIEVYRVYLPYTITVNKLKVIVTTAAAASTVQMGIYSYSGATGGSLICSTSTLPSTATGIESGTTSTTVLQPGFYWVAYVTSVNTVKVRGIPNNGDAWSDTSIAGSATNTVSGGVMPATLGSITGFTGGNQPIVMISNN